MVIVWLRLMMPEVTAAGMMAVSAVLLGKATPPQLFGSFQLPPVEAPVHV